MSKSMSFKDILKNDLENTFFLAEEFAERHTINGKEMDVLFDGIYTADLLLYVKVQDFGVPPKVGALLILDGSKTYRVKEVTEEMGVYAIALGANRA